MKQCNCFKFVHEILAEWSPTFTGYEGKQDVKVDEYRYLIGIPDCGKMQMWGVYHDPQVGLDFLFKFALC